MRHESSIESQMETIVESGWTVVKRVPPPIGFVVNTKAGLDGEEILLVRENAGWLKLDTSDADETPTHWKNWDAVAWIKEISAKQESGVPYLVEIWQNVNGTKLTWYEVMEYHDGNWVLQSDPTKRITGTQVAHRCTKIADIKDNDWINL